MGTRLKRAVAGIWLLALPAALPSDAGATDAPVPRECQSSNLSPEAQARCDFIARTPDLCARSGLSEETRRFCDSLDTTPAAAVCRLRKFRAVGHYYPCLLRAQQDAAKRQRCDQRFAMEFEAADRISPGCEPLDDLERTQTSVRSQAQDVLLGDVSQPPCATVSANGSLVTCWLNNPGENTAVSSVNLPDLLTQLQTTPTSECAPCAQITAETVLWLQAWGAGGGTGHAGSGGFAQTVTSIQSLEDDFGALTLYYYLAQGGTHNGASGGQGGAATIVTAQDLTTNPSDEPDQSMIILIAGGGGGGGGNDSACIVGTASPHSGGEGGIAISTTGLQGVGQGTNGGGGGKGGGQGVGGLGQGGGSEDGMAGIGGRGGAGGEGAGDKVSGNPGWVNTGSITLTLTNGQGGVGGGDSSSCTAGGGAGGGGWGGGGGGSHGNTEDHPGGGGGGGSFSIPSTSSDGDAPATRPSNPAGSQGFVQLVFNLDPS